MAWRRPGDKSLYEPIVVSLLTHIYASLGLNELTQIPAWISNHTPCGIELLIHSILNGATVAIWEWISNFIPHSITDVITQLGLKIIHVSNRGPIASDNHLNGKVSQMKFSSLAAPLSLWQLTVQVVTKVRQNDICVSVSKAHSEG